MIHYTNCPVCKSDAISFSFSATDHTVSKKHFEIWACNNCTLLFTQDIPAVTEIGTYYASDNYISHSNTKDGFINQAYHQVRKITLAGKKKLVNNETRLAAGRVLDIGAGTGAFANEMKHAGWEVTALEPEETARESAKSLHTLEVLPADFLFQLTGTFDAITMWHVLEHVHLLHEYIEQCAKLLKPSGRLFIAVPNHQSGDAKDYEENWAGWDVPRHLYHFTPASMNKLISAHGLAIKKMKPMWFDSFYVSMLSEKYKSGRNNLLSAFSKGLSSNLKALGSTEKCSSIIYVISHSGS